MHLNNLQNDEKIGPRERAKAPMERNIPRTVPFWLSELLFDAKVVKEGITVAEGIA